MAAFQFPSTQNGNVAPIRGGRNQNAEERKPSEYWLNVGITIPLPVGENGEMVGTFISLGGVAFDPEEIATVRANSSELWKNVAPAKNELHKILAEDLKALAKGQAEIHPMLQVEVRRVGEAVEAPQTNEAVSDLVRKAMGKAA